jgi:competence protein ComFC
MNKLLAYFIDFLFPPSKEELLLRELSPSQFLEQSPRSSKTEFPFIYSVFSYKDPLVREMIWQIKYKKNRHAVECAGFALYKELLKYVESKNIDKLTLVPIPISNKRRKERGYNQCELLIDEVLRLDVDNKFSADYGLLIRSKHIEKQTFKDKSQRIENTRDIFEVTKPADLLNKIRLIIIDDVTTTGSTIREAREILLRNGYKEVEGMAVGH